MVNHPVANLAVELVGTDVGLEEVVGAPLDGLLQVLHLSSGLIGGAIGDPTVCEDRHGSCHRVAELDVVSS